MRLWQASFQIFALWQASFQFALDRIDVCAKHICKRVCPGTTTDRHGPLIDWDTQGLQEETKERNLCVHSRIRGLIIVLAIDHGPRRRVQRCGGTDIQGSSENLLSDSFD